MWVRNQNMTGLVEVNSVFISGNRVMCKNWTLGTYESEERAIEVLDDIHNHIESIECAKDMKVSINNYTYQMPGR